MRKKVKKIMFLRLANGDDVISTVTKKTKTTVTLDNPMMIINDVQMDEGKQTMVLFAWLPQGIVIGNDVTLDLDLVVFMKPVEAEIIDYYEGMCVQFDTKPVVTASSSKKASQLEAQKGLNVVSFSDAVKNKKDLN